MNVLVRRMVSTTVEQFAGSGVGVDDRGRLCLPDGLDADRVHRFIELVLERSYASPKAALHELFKRVGVAPAAIGLLDDMLGDCGELDLSAIGRSPLRLGAALPRLLEIPTCFRRFLVEGLALGNPRGTTLEEAVTSTRRGAAERLGCRPDWDTILARPREVSELARPWRESIA